MQAGIWTIYIGYRNKQLGFHKARKFTNLCEQKAIILQLLDPEDVNNFPLPKSRF